MRLRLRRRDPVDHAPLDPLALLIQRAIETLEAAGEIRPEGWGSPPPRFDGYCARSCRAYYLLAKHWPEAGAEARYADARIRRSPGEPEDAHYWLELPDGRVLDLNYSPSDGPTRRFNYRRSESGQQFRRLKGDGRFPQRRDAQVIMRKVLADLGADPASY